MRAIRQLGADTLTVAYANILKDRADVAKARGQYLRTASLMERYVRLMEQRHEQHHLSDAQEYAARYHAIGDKNRVLARMINELSEAKAEQQLDASKPDKKIFDLIDGTIRREKLYTNINLQRQDIIDRFDIGRHALNDLFSAYADGQSFTAYINSLRLQEALHLIRKEPDTPVSAIAEAVGFTPSNFREQFKREFGMTPTEYRQNA